MRFKKLRLKTLRAKLLSAQFKRKFLYVGVVILILTALAATGLLAQNYFQPEPNYSLEITTPSSGQLGVYVQDSLELSTSMHVEAESAGEPQVVALRMRVDGAQAYQADLTLTGGSIDHDFSIDTSQLEEGEHEGVLELVKVNDGDSSEEVVLATKNITFIKDTTPPQFLLSSIPDDSTASVSTDSGTIKIFDTKPREVMISLNFSEQGTLQLEVPEAVTMNWDSQLTDVPTITIPDGQKPFTTTYIFTDQAGLLVEGELSYYYDNIPPVITNHSAKIASNKWGTTYAAMLRTNEPLSSISVSFNGQTITPYFNVDGYVARMTFSVGDNTFVVTATDKNGNTSVTTFTIPMVADPNPIDPYKSTSNNKSSSKACTDEDRQACSGGKSDQELYTSCDLFKSYSACLANRCDTKQYSSECGWGT